MNRLIRLMLYIILLGSLVASIFVIGYRLYDNQQILAESHKRVHEDLDTIRGQLLAQRRSLLPPELATAYSWKTVQHDVEDAVVQIFCHAEIFNWVEPYRAPRQVTGSGSGFFINKNGDILTNYHVVDSAKLIKIRIPSLGQEQFTAKIIGVCPDRDIALLGLDDDVLRDISYRLGGVASLELGDSDSVGRAEEVMALGFPLGRLSLKSTLGHISGWERMGNKSFLQLTSALNPGNSGGPTLNARGEVVGINTAIVQSAQSIGFCIPITEVKRALKDLYSTQLLRKPVLGANFTIYSDNMRNYLHNPDGGGWYITRVYGGTLLHKAGLTEGDVVYEIDGHQLDMYGDVEVSWATDKKVSVLDLLNRYGLRDVVHIVYYRRGVRYEVDVTLDDSFVLPIRKLYPQFEPVEYEVLGGMVVTPLNMDLLSMIVEGDNGRMPYLSKYVLPEHQYENSLIITNIMPDSPIKEEKIIEPGALIDEINGVRVRTIEEFRAAVIRSAKTKYLTIKTQDEHRFAVIAVSDILKNEARLAQTYAFPVSLCLKPLLRS